MRRRLVKHCVFLVLGAAVNVAVAWGFAICFDIWDEDHQWIERLGFAYERQESDQITWRVGFPACALTCTFLPSGEPTAGESISVPNPLPERYAFKGDCSTLPIEPLGPGFAINTALYAATLWLLFAAPLACCRRRIKRGLCRGARTRLA